MQSAISFVYFGLYTFLLMQVSVNVLGCYSIGIVRQYAYHTYRLMISVAKIVCKLRHWVCSVPVRPAFSTLQKYSINRKEGKI